MTDKEWVLWYIIAALLGVVCCCIIMDRMRPLPLTVRVRREPWEPDAQPIPPLDPDRPQ